MWYKILNWCKDLCIYLNCCEVTFSWFKNHFWFKLKTIFGVMYLLFSSQLWFLMNLEISYKHFHKHTFLVMMYFLSEIYLLFCIKTDSLWIIIIPIRNLKDFIGGITQLCCSNWLQVSLWNKSYWILMVCL